MSNENINIGNVGGNVSLNTGNGKMQQADGDIIGRDKITNTDNSYHGFKQEEDKAQFITELENLRTLMRSVRKEVEDGSDIDEDDKDEMVLALMNQIKALKEAKQQVADIPAGEEATEEQTRSIGDYIDTTNDIMERAETFGETMGELSLKIAPLVVAAQPMLMTVKGLFGL